MNGLLGLTKLKDPIEEILPFPEEEGLYFAVKAPAFQQGLLCFPRKGFGSRIRRSSTVLSQEEPAAPCIFSNLMLDPSASSPEGERLFKPFLPDQGNLGFGQGLHLPEENKIVLQVFMRVHDGCRISLNL